MLNSDPNYTQFASAERTSPSELQAQARILQDSPGLLQTLDLAPTQIFILNSDRQIVYANKAFRDRVGETAARSAQGLRYGEAVNCQYAEQNRAGCGTSEFCSMCGATRAILTSQKGTADTQECEILQKDGNALDLKVWASPLEIQGQRFTVFSVLDESASKRRRALERIFFHDILNTAGGLYGYADLLAELIPADQEPGQFARSIFDISGSIIEEIRAQKDLAAAESNELVPQLTPVDSLQMVREVASGYQVHEVARGKKVQVAEGSASLTLTTDRTLLKRVLGNMTKNALEASGPGQAVTLSCRAEGGQAAFTVHNPKPMPRSVQLQIFKRSFSTKGAGRGLGTYSMKLLTEHYLGGQVSFTSSEDQGTTFCAVLPLVPDAAVQPGRS